MILKNCEIWYLKANPKRPNSRFDKANPRWEVQLRTQDKSQKKEWEEAGLMVKSVVPDDDSPFYFRVNLSKKKFKADGSEAEHPVVVDAKLNPVDPDTVGHGSIAHVRVYMRDYKKQDGSPGRAAIFMGIQLKKHILYEPKDFEDEFQESDDDTMIVDQEETPF